MICKEFESTIFCFPWLFLGGFNVLVLSSIKFMIFVNDYQILLLLFMHLTFLSLHMIFLYLYSLLSLSHICWVCVFLQESRQWKQWNLNLHTAPLTITSATRAALSKFEFPCTSKLLGLLCKTSKTEELSQC